MCQKVQNKIEIEQDTTPIIVILNLKTIFRYQPSNSSQGNQKMRLKNANIGNTTAQHGRAVINNNFIQNIVPLVNNLDAR